MYSQQSLQDSLFLLLYGGVAVLATVAGMYMWLRRSNGILPDITTPRSLRRWTAAFFLMAAMSHVWWFVLGVYWLTDDRLVRNITAVTLDHILLVPLVMALMLRMLQDRQHKLWPWMLAQMPIAVSAVVGIVRHDEFYGFELTTYWQMTVMVVFVVYYIYALVVYGRWLRENYADLEHKEVWQSLLFAAVLFVVYELYFTNPGVMAREYLAQVETIVIIAFLIWRVETLQKLDPEEKQEIQSENVAVSADDASDELTATEVAKADAISRPTSQRKTKTKPVIDSSDIGQLLAYHCEQPQLYLKYDLTLSQLAETIGTSREALGAWFANHDDTYNAYINRLRIDNFVRLYREAAKSGRTSSVFGLAYKCGYRSYLSFSTAFKKYKGIAVSEWVEDLQVAESSQSASESTNTENNFRGG
jgi:AraC-like DNA-binding protein